MRTGAAPKRVLKTLFGEDGVQTLDDQEHHHRKAMFMSLMSREALRSMREITRKHWELAVSRWESEDNVEIYEEAQEMLCRVACEWAAVSLPEAEVKEKTGWLAAMIEATAAFGIKHRKGRHARAKAEKWMQELVVDVRSGTIEPKQGSTLHTMSWHRNLRGELLDKETAAVLPILPLCACACTEGFYLERICI
ncbi:hypothetical protein [Paenibacillus lautus]|uniref:hypothetical protein n=1 Tax=Paenibacillus lautus TaxID=1401 RepID=UPI001FE24F55|nr:hypothetical protein [Paenibacillus lautus]